MDTVSSASSTVSTATATVSGIQKPFQLIVELVFYWITFFPLLVYTFVEYVLFSGKKSVKDKVVVITGTGSGFGQGLAYKFASLGAKVACVDNNDVNSTETVAQINKAYPGVATAFKYDLTSLDDIKKLKEAITSQYGQVDVLINGADLIPQGAVTDIEDSDLQQTVSTNLTSQFRVIKQFLPAMKTRNEGHIIGVSSVAGFIGNANFSLYSATKHGVIGLMESVYQELREIPGNKIQTSYVCPYFVNETPYYVKYWNFRIPAITITFAVNSAVDGILRNERIITVPRFLYYPLVILQLLPDRLVDALRDILYIEGSARSTTDSITTKST